ncbi:hypothetical protein [Anabaena sp. CCY 0017]|uniref:hypothetical protein n=1 Tax=Anabaena sp. CCY 0017 TaxID=3103866 RepID=UPI0039C67EEB
MEYQNSFCLEIVFDKKQITSENLKQKLEVLLKEYLQKNLSFDINDSSKKSITLLLIGSLKTIDSCHNIINKFVIDSQLSCIRITDEAGDNIREQVYPILSQIEQRFRKFINQAILDVEDLDFEWWETVANPTLQQKAENIRSKSHEYGVPLHPLECTFFEDLVEIIESKISKISETKPLYIIDLIELLSRCSSIKKFKSELKLSIEKVSYWDRIFSRYFQDEKQWKSIKSSLRFIINERNKVMHHRPISLNAIETLSKKQQEIFSILDTVKTELTEEEINKTKQDITDLQEAVDNLNYHSLGENLILTDDFITELEELSTSEQERVHERLNYLNYLASNNLLFSSNAFHKVAHANNIYLFRVGSRIRIVCQLRCNNPLTINLIGVFEHNSKSSEKNLFKKIQNSNQY